MGFKGAARATAMTIVPPHPPTLQYYITIAAFLCYLATASTTPPCAAELPHKPSISVDQIKWLRGLDLACGL